MTENLHDDHDHDDEFCPSCWRWDPLASIRQDDDPPLDVITTGMVFFDIIFTGLPRLPRPGEELWSAGMGSCPGGIANLATASARLGMRTGLVTGFGDDAYGFWMRTTLAGQEHIDLSASRVFADSHSATTVSLAFQGDRGMVSHGHALPEPLLEDVSQVPHSKAAVIDLTGDNSWLDELARRGTLVFADVGFDETERWDSADLGGLDRCHAFTPNAVEAMAYTHTSSPKDALHKLADLVPLAIVTDGAAGSHAIDQTTGEETSCPALTVDAIDPTGAGDVFAASCLLGTLAGWPLEQRLRLASLSSSLAVREFGGSLAAPGWGDLSDWWRCAKARAAEGDPKAVELCFRYGFMDDIVPRHAVEGVRRAQGTFAIASDAGAHP
ncbi:carbohydrate kinase family protein [Tessaracoccus antarcticus]|uniref:Sugar kinase n=1 Tax=Tessaracoccus antarcticus TaxID=2479848 RepID=A0A3M0G230_9ACTN|nr:PfkB family carbohydrate kinase [Tessaracoccus antarcticus]RMB58177.1 sugar kinase [Tessaracoccus antarcticus]